jgi:hypothetical protein
MAIGQIADSCVLWTGFDISIVARTYAQFTGILAGFAFVVVNLVFDRAYRRRGEGRSLEPRDVEHDTQVAIALVCAFLGLFLITVRYGLLAGESGCALTEGRAGSAEVLAAVSFGASIYMLLYAIVQFFSGTAGILAKHCVFILAVLVPLITVFLVEDTLTHLALSLGDPETHRRLNPCGTGPPGSRFRYRWRSSSFVPRCGTSELGGGFRNRLSDASHDGSELSSRTSPSPSLPRW